MSSTPALPSSARNRSGSTTVGWGTAEPRGQACHRRAGLEPFPQRPRQGQPDEGPIDLGDRLGKVKLEAIVEILARPGAEAAGGHARSTHCAEHTTTRVRREAPQPEPHHRPRGPACWGRPQG